jgi:hypothetical protein
MNNLIFDLMYKCIISILFNIENQNADSHGHLTNQKSLNIYALEYIRFFLQFFLKLYKAQKLL